LWQELRNKKLNGLKFCRQHPLKNFVADFYCSEKSLVIEVDGGVYNNETVKDYDQARTNELKNLGITVLRFTNIEVETNMPDVLKRIIAFAKKEDESKS
jgi:very-short-patch-repair endonuclease